MKKRVTTIIAILAALLFLAVLLPGSVAAAGEKLLTATKVEGSAGSKVILTVNAENLKGSEGGQFTLTFDQGLVKPITIEPGDLILSSDGNLHMANLEYAPGELIFMWVTASADTDDSGAICRITFDLLTEGTTAIGFKDLVVVDGNGETPKSIAGQINIGPAGSGQETTTDSEQAADSGESDLEAGEEGSSEGVIDEEETENDQNLVTDRVGFNPLLVLVPIIIIVVLAVVYYLVKKQGKTS
jgi:hypothetical protein